MTITIIALDLSLSNTGIAIFNDTGKCIELLSIDTKQKESYSAKLKLIEKTMLQIKKKYKPSIIIIEESFSRFNKSTQAIYRVRGVAELVFYNVMQICYHATSIRKEILGKGNAKKEEVQKYILDNYKNISFKNFDESDAFAVGLCYFKKTGVL